jgi:hypothetical protein
VANRCHRCRDERLETRDYLAEIVQRSEGQKHRSGVVRVHCEMRSDSVKQGGLALEPSFEHGGDIKTVPNQAVSPPVLKFRPSADGVRHSFNLTA